MVVLSILWNKKNKGTVFEVRIVNMGNKKMELFPDFYCDFIQFRHGYTSLVP
jgi:hypothetical protein